MITGETPHSVNVFAFDDLVDVVKPGDRVEITGIFKAVRQLCTCECFAVVWSVLVYRDEGCCLICVLLVPT